MTPTTGSCVLRAADIVVTDVPPARGPDFSTGVLARAGDPAYVFIGGDTGGLCPATRSTTGLGLSISGTPVAITPPVGQGTFTLCRTGTSVNVAAARARGPKQ